VLAHCRGLLLQEQALLQVAPLPDVVPADQWAPAAVSVAARHLPPGSAAAAGAAGSERVAELRSAMARRAGQLADAYEGAYLRSSRQQPAGAGSGPGQGSSAGAPENAAARQPPSATVDEADLAARRR
jgi:hypothetical protein